MARLARAIHLSRSDPGDAHTDLAPVSFGFLAAQGVAVSDGRDGAAERASFNGDSLTRLNFVALRSFSLSAPAASERQSGEDKWRAHQTAVVSCYPPAVMLPILPKII